MTFTEPMELSDDSIRVLDPNGRRVDRGSTGHVGGNRATARVALERGSPQGTFTVSWKAVSADGHPIGEAFVFCVGAPSETNVALPDDPPGGDAAGLLFSAGRYVAYAGYVLLVGTCAFVLLCRPPGGGLHLVRRLLRVACAGPWPSKRPSPSPCWCSRPRSCTSRRRRWPCSVRSR